MKFISNLCRPLAAICLLTVMLASSCSKEESVDRRAELLALVPDNASVVALNPCAILKSAGADVNSKKIKLTKQLERLSEIDNAFGVYFNLITGADGVNRRSTVAGGTNDGYFWLIALDSPSAFISWAKKNDFEVTADEKQTVCLYETEGMPCAVIVEGNIGWIAATAPTAEDAIKYVADNKANAENNSFAQWKIDRMLKSDINMFIDVASYTEMIQKLYEQIGMNMNLPSFYSGKCAYGLSDINFDGPTVKMTAETLDKDGKTTPMFEPGTYTLIPSEMLALIKKHQIAFGFSIPDAWTEMFGTLYAQEEMSSFGKDYQNIVKSTLKCLKSMVSGISFDENASIATAKPTDLSGIFAIEYDKEAAEATAADWAALAQGTDFEATLSNSWKAWKEDSTFAISPVAQFPDFKIYFTGKENVALISTDANIADTKLKSDSSLDNLIAYISIDLKKTHPVLALVNCPFGIKLYGTTTADKGEGYLTLTDTDGQLIETLVNFISRF
ncbi:MAG: hypothetical protein K2J12_03105 [Muribaculaceae bacterium]|nr:hypothetical protein [Muribaculaceae bacterium]